ncbi:MAG: TIGR04076 family protein [Bacillota bacterium]
MLVKVTVLSQKGHCSAGHHVGDSWMIDQHTPAGICFSGFCSLLPWVQMLRFDGQTAWDVEIPCPDHENPVIFRLEKVKR